MDRGDIYHVDMNPAEGREQKGKRFVLIVSPRDFNRIFGTPLVVPITQGGEYTRHAGFAVTLMGAGLQTSGVVLCNQPRVLDLSNRKAKFIEKAPQSIIDEVIAKLSTLLE